MRVHLQPQGRKKKITRDQEKNVVDRSDGYLTEFEKDDIDHDEEFPLIEGNFFLENHLNSQDALPNSSGDVLPGVNSQEIISEENVQPPISDVQVQHRSLPETKWAKLTTGVIVAAALVFGAISSSQ